METIPKRKFFIEENEFLKILKNQNKTYLTINFYLKTYRLIKKSIAPKGIVIKKRKKDFLLSLQNKSNGYANAIKRIIHLCEKSQEK